MPELLRRLDRTVAARRGEGRDAGGRKHGFLCCAGRTGRGRSWRVAQDHQLGHLHHAHIFLEPGLRPRLPGMLRPPRGPQGRAFRRPRPLRLLRVLLEQARAAGVEWSSGVACVILGVLAETPSRRLACPLREVAAAPPDALRGRFLPLPQAALEREHLPDAAGRGRGLRRQGQRVRERAALLQLRLRTDDGAGRGPRQERSWNLPRRTCQPSKEGGFQRLARRRVPQA
mmetsp:Transcript_113175/g.359713  ORF Transcript_113175/g.359713 Transcript_113175/m.359713 type:complete len:229 (-) Transcript_113175:631-1317(-)